MTHNRPQRIGLMLITIVAVLIFGTIAANAQTTDCPSGKVCLDQQTANRLYDVAAQLVEAKDVINKMLTERGASDAALASANKVIEGWKSYAELQDMQIGKLKDLIELQERTIKLYSGLVENIEKRLTKPQSAWSKFLSALKTVVTLAAGVSLGRGL